MSLATEARWHWKTAEDNSAKPHLTIEWVKFIRELYSHGNSIVYIHNATGLKLETVRAIIKHTTFKNVI